MPTQLRKQPSRRAFVGLVGRPTDDPVNAPAVIPEIAVVAITPTRPGRPPIGPRAASPAERKAKSRASKLEKLADTERRNLVAKLMTMYRRMQPDIYADRTSQADIARAEELRRKEKQRRRKLYDEWLDLPLADLQNLRSTWQETRDNEGRLPNERSGEGNRRFGMTELESIIAGQYRDEKGRRVSPSGAGPTQMEEDDPSADSSNTPRSQKRTIPAKYLENQNDLDELMIEMAKDDVAEVDGKLHCNMCGDFINESDGREHFWREYEKGYQLLPKFAEESELEKITRDGDPASHSVVLARLENLRRRNAWRHYEFTQREFKAFRRRKTAKRKRLSIQNARNPSPN